MQFLYLLESIRCPFLDGLFSLVTELGGETLYMALAIAVYWCVSKGLGFYILTLSLISSILWSASLESPFTLEYER